MKRLLRLTVSSLSCLLEGLLSGADKKVGGQAVIEGVMMRSPSAWAVVVRDPEGHLHRHRESLRRPPLISRLPFLRGSVLLWDSLKLGMKALKFSAEVAMPEEEREGSAVWFGLSALVAVLLALGIFLLLPLYLTRTIGTVWSQVASSGVLFNTIDGLLRVTFFLIYVFGIGLWKEMRKIYQYHGAEHKVINAFEKNSDLEVSLIKSYSRFHPRCGTSFLLVVMVISILVFSFIPHSWPFYEKFLARVVLIPLVAGLSYEFIKLSSRRPFRALAAPGVLLQGLTTREPEESQIEVALASLREVL